jgi:hypothetical protein
MIVIVSGNITFTKIAFLKVNYILQNCECESGNRDIFPDSHSQFYISTCLLPLCRLKIPVFIFVYQKLTNKVERTFRLT